MVQPWELVNMTYISSAAQHPAHEQTVTVAIAVIMVVVITDVTASISSLLPSDVSRT